LKTVTIFLFLISAIGFSQDRFYTIDQSIEKELEVNKEADDMSEFAKGLNGYFGFMSNKMQKWLEPPDSRPVNPKKHIDTISVLSPSPCRCGIKNDTITIYGGIFYGGGIGFQLKIDKNGYQSNIIIASGEKHKKEKDGEFIKEFYLDNEERKLSFVSDPKFQLGETLKGKLLMESTTIYTQTSKGLVEDKYWMKILFDCILTDFIDW